ncbi:tic22-like family protein [Synechococcus sp. RS9909]|nr:hypothetical protein RS9917_01412 [Synechococcus sp. RS9917]QNI78884.1 tic22-like family protein [Synechococcus sp. RS9909]
MTTKHLHRAFALLGGLLLWGTAASGSAVRALPEAEVSAKLDTILLLMAVDDQGKPKAIPATIDGRSVQAYLAAISIQAAEQINAGERYGLSKNVAGSLRFTPVSLARFNQILAPLLQQNPEQLGVIAPDPSQVAAAEQLLVAQNVPAAKAKEIANLQPMVFCPEPGLLVTMNEGPAKGKQFVPCATEVDFVEGIVKRATKESPQLAKNQPRVIAIPLNAFIAYLRKEPADKVGQLRVVPSGRMVSLIQKLDQQKGN